MSWLMISNSISWGDRKQVQSGAFVFAVSCAFCVWPFSFFVVILGVWGNTLYYKSEKNPAQNALFLFISNC
jgi:hypothetical protein